VRNSPRRIFPIGEKIVKKFFAGILIFVAIFAILIFSAALISLMAIAGRGVGL
jgi:hypothetical protein